MLDEREYLNRQAKLAKARFRQTAHILVEEVLAPLQIRPFIQRRPWWCLVGAIATGFLSGLRLGRRGTSAAAERPRSRLRGAMSEVAVRARRLLRTSLSALVMANIRGPAHRATDAVPPVKPATNGHPDGRTASTTR